MKVETLDYHTAGEPLRIVLSGLPAVAGASMLERRQLMERDFDHYRRLLMLEPRGHADMYGAVITPPATPDADVGVLFMHNQGYSTMCGHGIIALVTAALEHQLFEIANPDRVEIDTPAGRIQASPNWSISRSSSERNQSPLVASVSFLNVPSFVLHHEVQVRVDGTLLSCVVAYGGAFYAYVDASAVGVSLQPSAAPELVRWGRRIKRAVAESCHIEHPQGSSDLNFLYGVIFVEHGDPSRNVCVFADGEIDRSPTGTGVSGRAAIHHARGDIMLNQALQIESLIGTRFSVRCVAETQVGDLPAVVPEVTGSAHICARNTFFLDPNDPLSDGFMIR